MDCAQRKVNDKIEIPIQWTDEWSITNVVKLTWLDALAELATSRFSIGICDFKNGKTYGRNGKLTDSCKACLNSSVDNVPL